jgi:hypothetical protein
MRTLLTCLLTCLLLAALAALPAVAQPAEPERLVIPLSDPSRPARVEVGLVMGSITVVAGKAGEVVLIAAHGAEADGEDEDGDRDEDDGRPSRAGMKRIPNRSLGLEAEEKDNRVQIGADSFARPIDLRLEVPAASTIEASTVNEGEIEVSGLAGELVLHNTNGGITVRDVTGPVNATTVNGDVEVVFGRSMAAAAMAFSTLNGDVDLTLPAGAKVDVLLRSDNGEIFSDFEVALERKPARVEEGRKKGKYRIAVSRELAGSIGGGGPELFLKTFNGDILLRRAK